MTNEPTVQTRNHRRKGRMSEAKAAAALAIADGESHLVRGLLAAAGVRSVSALREDQLDGFMLGLYLIQQPQRAAPVPHSRVRRLVLRLK